MVVVDGVGGIWIEHDADEAADGSLPLEGMGVDDVNSGVRTVGTRASEKSISKTDARNFIGEHVSLLRRVQGRVASAPCGNFRAARGSKNESNQSHEKTELKFCHRP